MEVSSGAVEAHHTIKYTKKRKEQKRDKTNVETPWLWRPPGHCPACPVLTPVLDLNFYLAGTF